MLDAEDNNSDNLYQEKINELLLDFNNDNFKTFSSFPNDNILDSTGAGDMFAGSFLYGITNGLGYAASGKLATKAASKVVGQYGPRLSWQQMRELLK